MSASIMPLILWAPQAGVGATSSRELEQIRPKERMFQPFLNFPNLASTMPSGITQETQIKRYAERLLNWQGFSIFTPREIQAVRNDR